MLLFSLLLAAAAEPGAAGGWPDADAYCSYVKETASSETDLLLVPELFATIGRVDVSDVSTTGVPGISHALRFTSGVNLSGQRLALGLLRPRWAAADCALYRSTSQLRALLFNAEEELQREALLARARVLDGKLPHAAEVLAEERRDVEIGRATVESLTAAQLRVDGLTALALQTHERLAALPKAAPHEPIPELLRRREAAARGLQSLEADARRWRAFDFTLRAGVDAEVDQRHQKTPVFGLVSVSFNPGFFAQLVHERRAAAAYAAWLPDEAGGLSTRSEQLLARLRAQLEGERKRLEEVSVLRADLEQHMSSIESIAGDRIRRFRDYLWLEVARIEAEQAYLEAHVATLEAALGARP
jgi:hypothetical protein